MAEMQAADEGGFDAGVVDGGRGGARLEVVAEVEVQEQPRAAANAQARPAALVQNRLRVGLGRLTSLVVGALLYPTLCSAAGAALFYLASRSSSHPSTPIKFLRRLLGVQAVLAAAVGKPPSGSTTTSWLRTLAAPRIVGGAAVDPVWVRNAIGGGLVLLVRDAIELTAGVLEGRRKASRRIVGRGFDPSLELDDGRTTTGGSEGASGGVDTRGRPAVVHTLL